MPTHKLIITASAIALTATISACSTGPSLDHQRESAAQSERFGDLSAAELTYRDILARRPGDWRSRRSLARVLLNQSRPNEAREHLEVVRALRPHDDETLALLTRVYTDSNNPDAAIAMMRADAQRTNTVADWSRLADYLVKIGDPDGAEEALLTAARIDAGQTVAVQLALAEFYRSIGDDETALSRYAMAIWLEPNNPTARAAIRSFGEVPGPTFAQVPAERGHN